MPRKNPSKLILKNQKVVYENLFVCCMQGKEIQVIKPVVDEKNKIMVIDDDSKVFGVDDYSAAYLI